MGQAAEGVYEFLLGELLGGVYRPGQRIREEDVAAQTGTSRTPVREALRRLHAEGLIELPPNRGAIVASESVQDVEELFDLRVLLEVYGAETAADRRTENDLTLLSDLCDRMEQIVQERGSYEALSELNVSFHRAVVGASRIERLVTMAAPLMVTPLVRETYRHYSSEALLRSMAQHREIISALRRQDAAWAKSVMNAHLLAAKSSMTSP